MFITITYQDSTVPEGSQLIVHLIAWKPDRRFQEARSSSASKFLVGRSLDMTIHQPRCFINIMSWKSIEVKVEGGQVFDAVNADTCARGTYIRGIRALGGVLLLLRVPARCSSSFLCARIFQERKSLQLPSSAAKACGFLRTAENSSRIQLPLQEGESMYADENLRRKGVATRKYSSDYGGLF